MSSFNNGSSIENNKRRLGKRLASDIIKHYRINPLFLSRGEGEMLLKDKTYTATGLSAATVIEKKGVPYYNVSLGELDSYAHADIFNESQPEYHVDYQPFNDCTAYLPVYGNSMHPLFTSGEIIAIKAVANPEIILWGEAYLIVTNQQANDIITIRQLHEHPDSEKIILRAANPQYQGDTIIHRVAIKKLYLIKGKITRFQL